MLWREHTSCFVVRSGCTNKDQGSLGKACSRKRNPRHRNLALSTTMMNTIIPQIITQIEIIIPACWNGPCATAQPCGMVKGVGEFIHQGVPEEGSEKRRVKQQSCRRAGAAYK